jgi:hypothetical protein
VIGPHDCRMVLSSGRKAANHSPPSLAGVSTDFKTCKLARSGSEPGEARSLWRRRMKRAPG